MENTGVYWRPVYEAIERYSPYYESIIVGNAHHMKSVPGRKSDVKDAEWSATLILHGLVQKSFVPISLFDYFEKPLAPTKICR